MIFEIFIIFLSLISLMVLHEFGHFILAKKFRVLVEEFGIGCPPRLFGKKFGSTLYSLNLLPFGAFVKIYGEEKEIKEPSSFSTKSIWQRALIILGGVLSFWVISAVIFSIVFGIGVPQAVEDEANHNLVNPKVQIVGIVPNSPAQLKGLKIGDNIIKVQNPEFEIQKIDKVKEVQEFTNEYKGQEITLIIQRGKKIFDVSLTPRESIPEGEGPIGVALSRIVITKYPWYLAPIKGIETTWKTSIFIVKGLFDALLNAIRGIPTGVQVMGPIGIGTLMFQFTQLGLSYFLQFIAIIAIYLAIFNILPIPVVDGGRLLFLLIEKFRGKPIDKKIEQNINAIFFALLIGLMIFVTIKDIARIF